MLRSFQLSFVMSCEAVKLREFQNRNEKPSRIRRVHWLDSDGFSPKYQMLNAFPSLQKGSTQGLAGLMLESINCSTHLPLKSEFQITTWLNSKSKLKAMLSILFAMRKSCHWKPISNEWGPIFSHVICAPALVSFGNDNCDLTRLCISFQIFGILCMALGSRAYYGGLHFFLFVVVLTFILTFMWICIYFFSIREGLQLPIPWIILVREMHMRMRFETSGRSGAICFNEMMTAVVSGILLHCRSHAAVFHCHDCPVRDSRRRLICGERGKRPLNVDS